MIEIAIIDYQGETLLNTLIKPTIAIPADSTAIHGITDEMVASSPTFPKIFPQIHTVLEGKRVLIYNASFDIRILGDNRRLHSLEPPLGLLKRSECIMQWYSQWCGDWSYHLEDYRWKPLRGGGHRALGDCQAALKLIQKMAADSIEIKYPKGVYPLPQRTVRG